ncbi:phytanoyl-CoA dioxygenase family protein [Endozoicomonas numazuensis]|uniref:Phytanoyl-CoA dioxygenase n=1 Tax=Endozoicomonas numazuensis TaxID=1137799 RepID=A0A081NCW1_9GAMM|nr:phytanoyl-CoA dioxygenase family protein [Endozoicomonas numazuensis]KEQ16284.1 phytanoyl-CoA dioxygenase [Endozoicomonas numazuensis]
MKNNYIKNGYIYLPDFFTDKELSEIKPVLLKFHKAWIADNQPFYHEKAVNSAYLTGTKYLNNLERLVLFKLIASEKIAYLLQSLPFQNPAFMNTQLFFNPHNPHQKNYWHRDPQYHLPEEQQKQALKGPEVIHLRIPLENEPGIELIPGTHKNWDSKEELAIRLEKNGKKNHENLSTGKVIPLQKGDLLLFSANMIHRGLYGKDRLALDVLFCEADPELLSFADKNCMPDEASMNLIDRPEPFANTLRIMTKQP